MARVLVHVPCGVYRTAEIAVPELDEPDSFRGQCFRLHEAGYSVEAVAEALECTSLRAFTAIELGRAQVEEVLQDDGKGWILPPW